MVAGHRRGPLINQFIFGAAIWAHRLARAFNWQVDTWMGIPQAHAIQRAMQGQFAAFDLIVGLMLCILLLLVVHATFLSFYR